MQTFKESITPYFQTEEMKKEFWQVTGKTFEEADEECIRSYIEYLEELAGYTE